MFDQAFEDAKQFVSKAKEELYSFLAEDVVKTGAYGMTTDPLTEEQLKERGYEGAIPTYEEITNEIEKPIINATEKLSQTGKDVAVYVKSIPGSVKKTTQKYDILIYVLIITMALVAFGYVLTPISRIYVNT